MKIIFLDIDGVLNCSESKSECLGYTGIDTVRIKRLKRIIEETNAKIILISFEQEIDAKHLEVEFDLQDERMYVNADSDALYQVLYNLCHNAIKFSRTGGRFTISIDSSDARKVTVSVFDEGQAISSEDLPHVFERFYKTDKSRGLDKSGVGLGLYICKTLVEAHDETISVSSVENVGTEFKFTLKKSK